LSRTLVRNLAVAAAAIALVVAVVIGINDASDSGDSSAGNPEAAAVDYEQALADAPPALAKLYDQGDALLQGGVDELQRQLDALRGHPVVVNAWASWCGPCRFEFPFFQEVAAQYGERVAFLGVDSYDSDAAAETFLDELPLPYPSVTDPDRDVWGEWDIRGLPATAFYDSKGERVYVRPGPYENAEDLIADVERYAQ
jgi:cytochrome c biogenesis protein CcmG, thiol:disulfide interchange protein DsbE